MCAGGQDIPVTLRVDGGIEDGQWKSTNDVLDTPAPQEDVQVTEATETEVMEPSAPLYKPVIERIDKLSERLPEKVAEETFEEVSPMMQEGFQMADNNQMDTMQMLERIMRNTRPRRPFNPRGPRGDGPFGKGGGSDPRKPTPRYQTLGANPQVAGLAGLFGRPKVLKPEQTTPTPYNFGFAQRNPSPENIAKFPQQQMATPMQPEVVEEQQQMEILGQPKQFAGGGLVNALMATPVGQAAIQKYQKGGDIKFKDFVFDYNLTDDDPLDILRGITYDDGRKARFFSSEAHMKDPSQPVVKWGRKEDIVEQITEDLTPQRRKKKKVEEPYQDDKGGSPVDPQAEVNVNQPTLMGPLGRGLLGLLVPGGGVLGALADKSAVSTALGKSSYAKSLQPTFMDHFLPSFLMDDKSKALYNKTVELMSHGNPYGRHSTLPGGAKLHDYTHSYGNEDEIDPYSPDMTTQSGRDVAEMAALQEQAAIESRDVDMGYGDSAGPGGGSEGMGGGYDESAPGEMGDDY